MITIDQKVNNSLANMIKELEAECLIYLKLVKDLDLNNLSDDELGNIMGSVGHFKVHTETMLDEFLGDND